MSKRPAPQPKAQPKAQINSMRELAEAFGLEIPDPMPTLEEVKKLPCRTWGKPISEDNASTLNTNTTPNREP